MARKPVSIEEREVMAIRNAIAAMYRGDCGELEAANDIHRCVVDVFKRGFYEAEVAPEVVASQYNAIEAVLAEE